MKKGKCRRQGPKGRP